MVKSKYSIYNNKYYTDMQKKMNKLCKLFVENLEWKKVSRTEKMNTSSLLLYNFYEKVRKHWIVNEIEYFRMLKKSLIFLTFEKDKLREFKSVLEF